MSTVNEQLLKDYPYLDLTPEDLQGMFDRDIVANSHRAKIVEYEAKITEYNERIAKNQADVDRLVDKRGELEAALRANDTELREARGRVTQDKYNRTVAERRIRERGATLTRRHRVIFQYEIRRRLATMGRELKLNIGQRAARKLGTAVLPRDEVEKKFPILPEE